MHLGDFFDNLQVEAEEILNNHGLGRKSDKKVVIQVIELIW